MNRLRTCTLISMLLLACHATACAVFVPKGKDNMIYRLTEDVSPYYNYYDYIMPMFDPMTDDREANLALWRKQTGGRCDTDELEWYVYTSSAEELKSRRSKATEVLGEDGFRLLCLAKEREKYVDYVNDPWYYPCKHDPQTLRMDSLLAEAKSCRGRYASRYALQAIRLLVATKKYREAVAYWNHWGKHMRHDVVRDMAERHVARAYLFTGDTLTAARIYARMGDMPSLYMCHLEWNEVWRTVYRQCPNSPFFPQELQYLLTHIDNGYYSDEADANTRRHVRTVLSIAAQATHDPRVKDKAMWYYAQAALLDATGQESQALAALRAGMRVCPKQSFLATSMRVLRVYIEAKTQPLDKHYEGRLCRDLQWMVDSAQAHLTSEVKARYGRRSNDGTSIFSNRYYWHDVLSRILVGTLTPRLLAQGRTADALLYANMGVFLPIKNVYGHASSPNKDGNYGLTDLSNEMADIAYTCRARDLVQAYNHILQPTRPIDSLFIKYGKSDKDYWHDLIGTHYIAQNMYGTAARWLKGVSHKYQKQISTWPYFGRDPFCFKLGMSSPRRSHLKSKLDYKLHFAQEMASLEETMKHAASADERGKAMIRYGIGLRNQKDWCWALSRYYDTRTVDDDYFQDDRPKALAINKDYRDSKRMIDQGIKTLESRELKAHYLHLLVRNREVMNKYPDTRTAQSLRAHCDLWRDYAMK